MKEIEFEDDVTELKGTWTFEIYEGDTDRLIEKHSFNNLITTVGKQLTLDRIFGLSAVAALTGMSVGTSATAAAVGNTSITGAVFKVFDATPIRTSLTVDAITTYTTAEANISINEVGLLTASGGTLFNRLAPIGPFAKTSAVSLKITVSIQQL